MSKDVDKPDVAQESVIADEMRAAIGAAAGPRQWSDTREAWLWRAAHKLGITPRRAKALWYREARAITAAEYVRITARAWAINEQNNRTLNHVAEVARIRVALAGDSAQLAGGEDGRAVDAAREPGGEGGEGR